jgi:hypothetical protein
MNAFLALCVSGAAVQDKLFLSPNVKTYISGNDLNLWWGIATGGPRVLNLPSSDQDDNPGLPNLSTALIFLKVTLQRILATWYMLLWVLRMHVMILECKSTILSLFAKYISASWTMF